MFDYRYHALSLAAVLLALAVGVLIGVAIGDSNLVSSAKNGIVHDLNVEVNGAQRHAAKLREQLAASETLQEALYPIAVHDLLKGHAVGLVFLGAPSDEVNGLVREAVTQAGGNLVTVVAVREPLDLEGLGREATGTRYAALAADPALARRFGVRIGVQLVHGGKLLRRVQARLLSSFDGRLGGLDGLVVTRADPPHLSGVQARATEAFQAGLVSGAGAPTGVDTVGVELSAADPSQIPWYQGQDIASVDDLDTLAGRAALAFALAGDRGAYGAKPTATAGLLPRAVSVP
jgi:Copper transport outer membrane protein, MctB